MSDGTVVVATCLEGDCPYQDTLDDDKSWDRYFKHVTVVDHLVEVEKLRGQVNRQ